MSKPLILPKICHPDFSTPGKKPVGPVEIDWSNPINRGLKNLLLPNSSIFDIVGNSSSTTNPFISAKQSADSDGQYYQRTSTTNEGINLPPSTITGSQNRTLVILHKRTGNESFRHLFSLGTNAFGNRWTIVYNGTSLRLEIQGSGYTSALSPPLNELCFTAIVLDGTTLADHTFFVNGSIEQATGTQTVDTTSNIFEILDGGINGQSAAQDKLYFLGLFDRALSTVELNSLYRDPYQLLKPRIDPVYFIPAAAGVSGTASVSSATGTTATGTKQGSGASSVSSTSAAISQGSKDVSGTASESAITGTTESGRKEASSSSSVSSVTNTASIGTSGLSGDASVSSATGTTSTGTKAASDSASTTSVTGSAASATKAASSDVSVSAASSTSAIGTVVETRSGAASVSASSNSISSGSKSSTGDSLVSSSSDTTTVSTTNRVGISSVSVSSSVAFQAFKAISEGLFVSSATSVSASGIKQITGESTSNITSKRIVTIVDDAVMTISINDEAIIVNV